MNPSLWLLALCQGLFLTNNVVFIAINGLVGFSLAPLGWMATLPVMGYVVGGALSTGLVAKAPAAPPPAKTKKLSFKGQRELDALPEQIAALEAEQNDFTEALANGRLFASDDARAVELSERDAQIDDALMTALERWEVLGKPG